MRKVSVSQLLFICCLLDFVELCGWIDDESDWFRIVDYDWLLYIAFVESLHCFLKDLYMRFLRDD